MLPKLATPKYDMIVPSTGDTITYRPYVVKEEKLLLIAMESQDDVQIEQAISDIIRSCLDNVKLEDLTGFDIEFIFLTLRARSVGEGIELLIPCENVSVPKQQLLLPNAPRAYRHGTHRGIDFYVNWGTPVRAVADGIITRAEHDYKEMSADFRLDVLGDAKILGRTPSDVFEHLLLGQAVYIDHGFDLVPGYRVVTIYAHMSHINSSITIGSIVRRGEVIGQSGNTGTKDSTLKKKTGAHLHWEMILQNKAGEYYLGQGEKYEVLYTFMENLFTDN